MEYVDSDQIEALRKHLREWSQLNERIGVDLSKTAKAFIDSMAVPDLSSEALAESVKIAIPKFDLPDFTAFTSQLDDAQKIASEAMQWTQAMISPAFADFQESFRQLPPRAQEAALTLADNGWYLDWKMTIPDLWELNKALLGGNADQAEIELVEHFTNRADGIENELLTKFPHRAHLIRSAFGAHRREEYELSIPVFLAQADGICFDVINMSVFRSEKNRPLTASYVDTVARDTLRAALLSPLSRTLPINATERQRPPGSTALNRHTVLHGESLDYGNKANSLKAISFVNYIAHVLRDDAGD
jgi:hypothetical protein